VAGIISLGPDGLASTITLPVWLVFLLCLIAAIVLLDRILLPGVRWALRRRANRAIEKLNTRLRLHIQPFKTTRRKELIDRLSLDSAVLRAVDQRASETGEPRKVALERARRYAGEIVPSFSAFAYFRIGTKLAQIISRSLYRVRLGYLNDQSLRAIDRDATVVFVINHRSNMDYILVTYLAATASALSYAVGEWAQIWGLRSLIRTMGAYFIRRNSRNQLYRRVLSRYVAMATGAGVTQAVFLEGGLSRDGCLRPPKLGLLSYMLAGAAEADQRDIVFVPVGLNYDRVLEDRVLVAVSQDDEQKAPKFRFSASSIVGFAFNQMWLRLRGRWHRFGYACVSFGEPVSLNAWQAERSITLASLENEERNKAIDRLGENLITAIGKVVPALPVSLAAHVMLETLSRPAGGSAQETSLTAFEVKGKIFALIQRLEDQGAHVHIPRSDLDYAIDVGLRMLNLRHLVIWDGDVVRANADEVALLQYYANAIAHLLPTVKSPS